MGDKVSAIDLLLRPNAPEVVQARQTAAFEVKRLSRDLGAPFVLELRGLSYNQYQDLAGSRNANVDIVLEGVTAPDLRDPRLLAQYKAATPVDVVKAVFLPGEISDIARQIEKLTGFRGDTLKEIQKN